MKNKATYIIILFLTIVICNNGCVNDDMSTCLSNNIKLDFYLYSYPEEKDSIRFMNYIRSVDVFVFNSDSFFVTSKRVMKNDIEHTGFQGTNLSLLPGNYLIACWANADSSTEISPMTKCKTLLGETYVSLFAVPGDSLYYAPAKIHDNSYAASINQGDKLRPDSLYSIEVNYGDQQVKDVEFIRAYRAINVYIIGYSGTKSEMQPPLVELSDISTVYDFEYHTLSSTKKSFIKTAQMTTQETPGLAWSPWTTHFYTIYEPITDNIQVKVKDPETTLTLGFVKLKEYMDSHSELDPDNIDILFEFSGNTFISVSVPPWSIHIIDPSY